MARDRTGPGWRARPRLATSLGAVALVLPSLLGVAAALVLARVLPRPEGATAVATWWVVVLTTPIAVAAVVERLARRLLPLVHLLRLSLVFPDRTPSRYRVARQANRLRTLREQLLDPESGASPASAAETLALIAALEAHDGHTRGHSGRVLLFVDLLAEELDIDAEDRERLRWAALLHDIGKLDVDPEVLNKHGRPDHHEWAALRRHPSVGMRLAAPIVSWLGPWRGAISEHHERWDGTGYPRGLAGTDISLAGRITAVADVYETLTAGRPYRDAVGPEPARAELVRVAGTQLDPRVVRAFLAISVGRLARATRIVAPFAALAGLLHLGAVPARARDGAVATGTVAVLAVTGVVAPPAPTTLAPPAPPVAAEEPEPPTIDAPRDEPTPPPPPSTTSEPREPVFRPARSGGDPDDGAGAPPRAGDGEPAPDPEPTPRPAPAPPGDAPPPAVDTTASSTSLYLAGDGGTGGELALEPRRPTATDRDGLPLAPADTQAWATGWEGDGLAAGPIELVLWVAGDGTGPATVAATLDRCDADGTCVTVGSGQATTSGGADAQRVSLSLGADVWATAGTRLRLTVGNAGDLPLELQVGTAATPATLVLVSARPALLAELDPTDPGTSLGDLPPPACLSPVAGPLEQLTGRSCAEIA